MLSISTCWNSWRHKKGDEMIAELARFGFDAIELGHGIRVSLMPGILKMAEQGVRFSSLHNFCPLPVEITKASPDCLQFSSHRDAERQRAVSQTCKTIDFAAQLGAPFVVLHLGRVEMTPVTRPLIDLASEGGHLSAEYARMKVAGVIEREKKAPPALQRVRDCLKRIVDHAASKGIRLGVEGRHSYEEIPTERECWDLLEEFNTPTVGYWHDIGHIQIKENLGFVDHAAWLKKVGPRLLGCHLHDVRWPGKDHQAPFTGGAVDYPTLIPPLLQLAQQEGGYEGLFVWEMNPNVEEEEIQESLCLWRERYPLHAQV